LSSCRVFCAVLCCLVRRVVLSCLVVSWLCCVVLFMSCVVYCLVLFCCLVLSCAVWCGVGLSSASLVFYCVVLFSLVLSCLVLSCLALLCFALSCVVLFCLVLSCLVVLSCVVLSCPSCLVIVSSLSHHCLVIELSCLVLPRWHEHMFGDDPYSFHPCNLGRETGTKKDTQKTSLPNISLDISLLGAWGKFRENSESFFLYFSPLPLPCMYELRAKRFDESRDNH
jgi:hypothetical protein